MRIAACAAMGIEDTVDLSTLLTLQSEDGGFQIGWIYKYGNSGIKIGNRGLTTAFAIHAIECMRHFQGHPPSEPIQRPGLT
ncbi:hypothetical protein FB45DRAFT_194610 [Roridomyces roridus]|uniref:Uncharacterized protein n=1 Tax=Roridomyces roridus TaxID=1738132 RepID=A0AAD7CF61_9AGAR|nr:hypothetical protein FB45DRAFT_194610 [Roridomyces roridus]